MKLLGVDERKAWTYKSGGDQKTVALPRETMLLDPSDLPFQQRPVNRLRPWCGGFGVDGFKGVGTLKFTVGYDRIWNLNGKFTQAFNFNLNSFPYRGRGNDAGERAIISDITPGKAHTIMVKVLSGSINKAMQFYFRAYSGGTLMESTQITLPAGQTEARVVKVLNYNINNAYVYVLSNTTWTNAKIGMMIAEGDLTEFVPYNGTIQTEKNIVDAIYPIGSIYISVDFNSPAALFGGGWTAIPGDKALWTTAWTTSTTTDLSGSTIAAGLPNITGSYKSGQQFSLYDNTPNDKAIRNYKASTGKYINYGNNNATRTAGFILDASYSNSIYGNSSTVQPPAQRVYAWRRVS